MKINLDLLQPPVDYKHHDKHLQIDWPRSMRQKNNFWHFLAKLLTDTSLLLLLFHVFHSTLATETRSPQMTVSLTADSTADTDPDSTQPHRTAERSVGDFDYGYELYDGVRETPYGGSLSGSILTTEDDAPTIVRRRSAEHVLHSTLFAPGRYQKNVRPLVDHGKPIKVRLGVCVMTIDEIIEKDQTMITSGCVKMKWTDEFLQWLPSDYKNLSWMALPSTEIWIPDIALINSPDPYYITRKKAFSEVTHNGDVGYYPSGRFSTRCQISLTYFPFDLQKCELRFESWVYPWQWLYMEPWSPEPVDMKDYYRNHQWDLERFTVTSRNTTYDGLQFSAIRFSFYFRRRTLYYLVLSIFPCLIMSVLQMFSHTLPVEHPARMTLLTSLFVSSSVIQSSLASQMPKSSDGVSLIQLYLMIFSTNLLISMLITFMNMHVWFRVPMSMVPSCYRMMRAYFLDTGKPQKPPATAASALAAISAAAMPLVPIKASIEQPEQPSNSPGILKRISSRILSSSASLHRSKDDADTDDFEANIALKPSHAARKMSRGPRQSQHLEPEEKEESEAEIPESSLSAVALKPAFDYTYRQPDTTPESSSAEDVQHNYYVDEGKITTTPQRNRRSKKNGAGKRGSISRTNTSTSSLRHRGKHPSSTPASTSRGKPKAMLSVPKSPVPPPSQENRDESGRRGAVISLKPGRPFDHVPNLAERKDRWLQFSMLIDKVFLYAMLVYNLLCPIVIFGLVPQIQTLYVDDDEGGEQFYPPST